MTPPSHVADAQLNRKSIGQTLLEAGLVTPGSSSGHWTVPQVKADCWAGT